MRTVYAIRCYTRKGTLIAGMFAFALVVVGITEATTGQVMTAPIQPHIRNLMDVDGNLAGDSSSPLDSTTPVYRINSDPPDPVLGPDGHHFTLGEWQQVAGTAQIERMPDGTQLTIDVTGLVPNGVYTVWGAYFDDPPFNFDPFLPNFPDNIGLGAVGTNDGSDARFDADDNGTATFSVLMPPGPLSMSGDAPLWALDGVSNFALVTMYHIDGQTYGTVPGPNHVGHFFAGFTAIPEPSSLAMALSLAVCAAVGTWRMRRRASSSCPCSTS